MNIEQARKYYRFECGRFIKASSFEKAKAAFIAEIEKEKESKDSWHTCTCLGLSHHYDCPEYVETL